MSLWDVTSSRRQDDVRPGFFVSSVQDRVALHVCQGISPKPTRSAFLVGRVMLPPPPIV